MKRCSVCGSNKPRTEFYARSANRDGLQGSCKACNARYIKDWKDRSPEYKKETTGKRKKDS